MFKNYLKIALRNILKHKSYSLINIIGLTIGMACFILIALYIQHELSYDKFHKNSDHIYRLNTKQDYTASGSDIFNMTPAPLAEVLKSDYPEIDHITRLRKESRDPLILVGENSFLEENFFYTDPDFLEMFSFPLVSGNVKTALTEPYSIILTEKIAHKYFGQENPIGKTITVNQKHQQQPYTITGVVKNTPANTHLRFNLLASFSTIYKQRDSENQEHSMHWNAAGFYTYVRLKGHTSPQAFEADLVNLVKKYKGQDAKIRYMLEPIERIHLYQNWKRDIDNNGDIRYIYFYAAIGFFLLMIACVNYINISTAQSVKRAKEVGLRKVVGASRGQLIKQFLSESLIFSLLGFCLAILVVQIVWPSLQSFLGKDMHLSIFTDVKMLLSLLGILLFTGCSAGVYPAFLFSAFQPTHILKGVTKRKSKSFFSLRNALVIFQFVISVVLIIGTITVYNQLHYVKNKKLGFKKDHIVAIKVLDEKLQENHSSFFNELSSNPHVIDASASQSLPPGSSGSSNIDWDGKKETDLSLMQGIRADYRFAHVYEIPVILGNNSLEKGYSSSKSYFLLNRSAYKALGWKNALGKRFGWNDTEKENGQILGIVSDFHFLPLHHAIEPLAIELVGSHLKNWQARFFSIKISSQDISGTLSFIEKKWKIYSQYPLQFEFFDSRMDMMYRAEQRFAQFFNIFALIAIFIGCMGLYGLILSSVEQRIKEIGIRKVLGASIYQIHSLMTKETAVCILFANLIAWPIAWYGMNKWLQNFAYRIDVGLWIFVISGGLALLIALATVSFQAIKAATANPVESLKYE